MSDFDLALAMLPESEREQATARVRQLQSQMLPAGRIAAGFLPAIGETQSFNDLRNAKSASDAVYGLVGMLPLLGGAVRGVRGATKAVDAMADAARGVDKAGDAARATDAAADASKGFKAYHGSPHDFDKFDLAKIGTGEGAQAYGHGLYFAENEGVAKSYRDILGRYNVKLDGESLTDLIGSARIQEKLRDIGMSNADAVFGGHVLSEIERTGKSVADVKAEFLEKAVRYKKELGLDISDDVTRLNKILSIVEPKLTGQRSGHMYEVNIKADPEMFLDWDKPRDQLAPAVREWAQKNFPREWENAADGSSLYNLIAKTVGADAASRSAQEAGIPGIRYLDQGSRSATDGTRNAVVFDPSLVEILRKYGLLAPVAAGAAATAMANDASAAEDTLARAMVP